MFEIFRGTKKTSREYYKRSTGGHFFSNYDMKSRAVARRQPKYIADKFLHARFIAVLSDSSYLPNGLLVSSDHQARHSLFHMTAEEYDVIVRAFLDDRIRYESDWIDVDTGEVFARRK